MDVIGNAEVAQDHRRGAQGAAPADVRAAGHGDAAGHGGVRADAHVMADLNLVVELHAILEHGVVERAAIDGGVGADLYIVADHYSPDLGDLDPALAFAGDAEAVGADHHPRMHDR